MHAVTQEAMRGPSARSVGDRELMVSFVAHANSSAWCIRAHTAVATRAFGDAAKVSATLADLDAAPIDEQLRATLRVLGRLTRDALVSNQSGRAPMAAAPGVMLQGAVVPAWEGDGVPTGEPPR